MEVPNNYSLDALIDLSRKLQGFLGEFKAMYKELLKQVLPGKLGSANSVKRKAASLMLRREFKKKTGYAPSKWGKEFEKLAEQSEAMKNSDEKAKKDFKSYLSSLIEKLGKLSEFCEHIQNDLPLLSEMKEKAGDKKIYQIYLIPGNFKANLDGLILLIKKLQI